MESIFAVILVSVLGLLTYIVQKNYEEIRDAYIKDGLEFLRQEISFCFAVFNENYISLLTLLKNINYRITNKNLLMAFKVF